MYDANRISRIDSYIKGRGDKKGSIGKKAVLLLSIYAVFIAIQLLLTTQIGYAISYGGEIIGTVKTKNEAEAVVREVEEQVKDVLGDWDSLDSDITVTAGLHPEPDDVESVKTTILDNIDEIVKLNVLRVNGIIVGAAEDASVFDGILDDIFAEYTNDNTVSIRTLQTVSVGEEYVGRDAVKEPEEMRRMLDPENTTSITRLVIECVEDVEYNEIIKYGTVYNNDENMYSDECVVTTEGEDGLRRCFAKAVRINGKQIMRTDSVSETIREPISECVTIGTKERPTTASHGVYIWPADGIVTSEFGYRYVDVGSSFHNGIDIAGDYGQPIYASDGGVVILSDWYYGYGLTVMIEHDDGTVTLYGHCSDTLVSEGERVYQGQQIAEMGSTGNSTGEHVHFEVRINDEAVDPRTVLPEQNV